MVGSDVRVSEPGSTSSRTAAAGRGAVERIENVLAAESRAADHAEGGLRMIAVHAHPDDESSKGAATLAKYAADGADVMVVTCTGGEAGSVLNPAMDRPGVRENMPQLRREEMAKAVKILGVKHHWLGFVDSGLPEGDPPPPVPDGTFAAVSIEEPTRELVKVFREFRPHVVLTYDETGGYPHPDHIRCHQVSVAAFEAAAEEDRFPEAGKPWQPLKLYYMHGFSRGRMELFHEALLAAGLESPYAEWLQRWDPNRPDPMKRVTTRVECGDYFEARDEALRAHATQIDPNSRWFAAPLDMQRKLWPTEEYELVSSLVDTTLPEDDLFAGIRR